MNGSAKKADASSSSSSDSDSDSSDDEDAIPSHAEWITVEILLEWFESASIVEVLLMGNKHLSEQARKLHATHPTAETMALCRMERYPGVTGHPQVAKKSFQFNKKSKTSLIKFLSCPHKKRYGPGGGYGGLTPQVLDVIWFWGFAF